MPPVSGVLTKLKLTTTTKTRNLIKLAILAVAVWYHLFNKLQIPRDAYFCFVILQFDYKSLSTITCILCWRQSGFFWERLLFFYSRTENHLLMPQQMMRMTTRKRPKRNLFTVCRFIFGVDFFSFVFCIIWKTITLCNWLCDWNCISWLWTLKQTIASKHTTWWATYIVWGEKQPDLSTSSFLFQKVHSTTMRLDVLQWESFFL